MEEGQRQDGSYVESNVDHVLILVVMEEGQRQFTLNVVRVQLFES